MLRFDMNSDYSYQTQALTFSQLVVEQTLNWLVARIPPGYMYPQHLIPIPHCHNSPTIAQLNK